MVRHGGQRHAWVSLQGKQKRDLKPGAPLHFWNGRMSPAVGIWCAGSTNPIGVRPVILEIGASDLSKNTSLSRSKTKKKVCGRQIQLAAGSFSVFLCSTCVDEVTLKWKVKGIALYSPRTSRRVDRSAEGSGVRGSTVCRGSPRSECLGCKYPLSSQESARSQTRGWKWEQKNGQRGLKRRNENKTQRKWQSRKARVSWFVGKKK